MDGVAGKSGCSAIPSSPRSQKLCTCVRRSAKVVGVVSCSDENTLIRPLFSAMNTRPSGAKRITVGFVSPLKATLSLNPAGNVAAPADAGTQAAMTAASTAAERQRDIRLLPRLGDPTPRPCGAP